MTWHAKLGFARRRTLALVAAAWLLVGFVVWNDVFDTMIIDAGRAYVRNQRLYDQGRAQAVTIDQIMRPAQAQAIRRASASGLGVAGLGFGASVLVAARLAARRRRRATSTPSSPVVPR